MVFGSLVMAVAMAAGAHGDGHGEEAEMSAALAEALAGFERTGETRSCLSTYSIDEIDPIDDSHWMVTTRGRGTFLTEVSRGCRNADNGFTYLQYQVTGGRLCRGDIVRVMSQSGGFVEGSCSLGDYEELSPVE